MPVLFLTAKDATEDKITGLTLGGDDYVTKPFSLEEVIARIRAVLRRLAMRPSPAPAAARLAFADIELDDDSHEVWKDGEAGHAVADRVQAAAILPAEPHPGAEQGADPRPRLALRLRRRRQRRRVLRLLPAPQDRHHRTAAAAHDPQRRLRPPPATTVNAAPAARPRSAPRPRRTPLRIKLVGDGARCSPQSASASPAIATTDVAARLPDRPGRRPAADTSARCGASRLRRAHVGVPSRLRPGARGRRRDGPRTTASDPQLPSQFYVAQFDCRTADARRARTPHRSRRSRRPQLPVLTIGQRDRAVAPRRSPCRRRTASRRGASMTVVHPDGSGRRGRDLAVRRRPHRQSRDPARGRDRRCACWS